jgi:Tol biopolymer transport system component
VDSSGKPARRLLSPSGVIAADWSPDGSKLAVISRGSKPGTLQLWIGGSDGSELKRVGTPFEGTHASIDW